MNPIVSNFHFQYGQRAIKKLEDEFKKASDKIPKNEKQIQMFNNYLLQLNKSKHKDKEWRERKKNNLKLITLFKESIEILKNKQARILKEIENLKNTDNTEKEVDNWFDICIKKETLRKFVRQDDCPKEQEKIKQLFEKNCPKEICICDLLNDRIFDKYKYDKNHVKFLLDKVKLQRALRLDFFYILEENGGYKKDALENCWRKKISWFKDKKIKEEIEQDETIQIPKITIAKKICNWIHRNINLLVYITTNGKDVDSWFFTKITKEELRQFIKQDKSQEKIHQLFEKYCPKKIWKYNLFDEKGNPVKSYLDMVRLQRVLYFSFFSDLEKKGYEKWELEKYWVEELRKAKSLRTWWKYKRIEKKTKNTDRIYKVSNKIPKIPNAKKVCNWKNIKPIIYITTSISIIFIALASLILVGGIFKYVLKIY